MDRMNNDIRLGIVLSMAAIGFLLFFIEVFGRGLVACLIIGVLVFFALIYWRKFQVDIRRQEAEIEINQFQKRMKPLSNGMVLYDPAAMQLIHDESIQPLEKPEETSCTGSTPVHEKPVQSLENDIEKSGIGEWSQEEKIKVLYSLGVSKNAICSAVFGSKNKPNMDVLERVIG